MSVLDIGAGGGRWEKHIAPKVGSIVALEPSSIFDVLIERTSCHHNVQCINCSFEDYQPKELFDTIIISGVLMYQPNEKEIYSFLCKACQFLKENGYLIVREHMFHKKTYFYDQKYYHDYDHNRYASSSYWETILTEAFYTKSCQDCNLKKIASFKNHGFPFLHNIFPKGSLRSHIHLGVINGLLSMNSYVLCKINQLSRKVLGFALYYYTKQMKILIFEKKTAL